MSEVKKIGKIRYIEPNDFLNDYGTDNIVQAYENYSISVDLIVKKPNRLTLTSSDKTFTMDTNYTDENSLGGKKFSFFSGTNGFMTDTPGTIVYSDILNGDMDGVNENLGITNIHITYNSYFYPEVSVTFTDVRGSALMMPQEENYRREYVNNVDQKNGRDKTFDVSVESFFSALFAFPSPEFVLSVKGFYGKKIEYSLIVKDFKSSFNASTGNFDARVDFVGKMYGVYTDIPMAYLIIAPYCKYGGANNKTIWETKNFKFDSGAPMLTFLEIKDKLSNNNDELNILYNQSNASSYKEDRNKEIQLDKIESILNEIITFLSKNRDSSLNICMSSREQGLIILEENYCKDRLFKPSDEYFKKLLVELYNGIEAYGNGLSKIDKLPNVSDGFNNIKSTYYLDVAYNLNDTATITGSGLDMLNSEVSLESIKETLKNYTIGKKEDRKYYLLSYKELIKNIANEKISNSDKLKSERESLQNKIDAELERILGFKPSIRNMFKVLMAHLETFVDIFHNFIINVNTSGRNINNLTGLTGPISFKSLCDLPTQDGNENAPSTIPPFPAFKDNIDNTYCYPKKLGLYLEECNFVDALFDCAGKYQKLEAESNNKIDSSELEMIPTCISDIYIIKNPYKNTFAYNNGTIFVDWIMTFFGLRLMNAFGYHQISPFFASDDFGKYEAYNFWKVNKNLDKRVIEMMENDNFNGENFIKFLRNNKDNNPYIKDDFACYTHTKTKINEKESLPNRIYQISSDFMTNETFCTKAFMIGRDDNAYESFLKDEKTPTPGYCVSGVAAPYNFIKLIPKSLIQDWGQKLGQTNIPELSVSGETLSKVTEPFNKVINKIFENDASRIYLHTNQTLGGGNEQFYETHDNVVPNYKRLDDYYKNNCPDSYRLLAINGDYNSIFFHSGLTAEEFLTNIQWDCEQLHGVFNKASNFKATTALGSIINIPYPILLYLGMLIHHMKNKTKPWFFEHDPNSSHPNDERYMQYTGFPFKYPKKYIDAYVNNLNGHITSADGKWIFYSRYYSFALLTRVLQLLIRYEDGSFITYQFRPGNGDNRYVYSIDNLETLFNTIIKDKRDIIDPAGIAKVYEKWASDEKPGGFLYFKKQYTLKEKEITLKQKKGYGDVYVWSSGVDFHRNCDTTFKRLKHFKESLTTKERDNLKEVLNNSFVTLDGESSPTIFTDRYSRVILQNYGFTACFNTDFPAYSYLREFFTKNETLIIPTVTSINGSTGELLNRLTYYPKSNIVTHFNTFKSSLLALYKNNEPDRQNEFNSLTVSEESKLSMYRTLKNLYDKHFYSLPNDKSVYEIDKDDSEYSRVHFIDTFYNDIGQDILCNAEQLSDILASISSGIYNDNTTINSDMTVFSFMSLLCQKSNMMLLSMPVFNGKMTGIEGNDNLEKMFTPLTYQETVNDNFMSGPSYICFYPHQTSQHLDIPNGQYKNDGFNLIQDINGTGNFEGPIDIQDLYEESEDNPYVVPAFSVEYGSQKQSIFKSVNVNMDNPQVTETSVAMQFNLAKKNNDEPNNLGFEGQDLFKIYSNYSFTCQVEMMGCAQIQPLMYFQLNNIPMFRGAYQIIRVEHNITPGDMTTNFTGVRINKTKIPLVKNGFNIQMLNNAMDNMSSYDTYKYADSNEKNINLFGNIDNDTSLATTCHNGIDLTYEEIINQGVNISVAKVSTYIPTGNTTDSKIEAFNNLNPYIKSLLVSIASRMETQGLGVRVTSMTRNYKKNNSDHTSPSENVIRTKVKYEMNDGTIIKASERGCAVDLVGMNENNTPDTVKGSVPLFHLIATEFTDSIRQLIWEVNNNCYTNSDSVSNCVHLASYAKYGEGCSKKPEIYVAKYENSKWQSFEADNTKDYSKAPTNLPPRFIRTLYDLSQNEEKYNLVYLNNFERFYKKPTKEQLGKWCKELNV